MEAILKAVTRRKGLTTVIVLLVIAAIVYARVLSLDADQQKVLLYAVQDYLPMVMFVTLAMLCLLYTSPSPRD